MEIRWNNKASEGNSDRCFDTAASKAGVDDFLGKPFSSLQLLSKVRDYVPDALAG